MVEQLLLKLEELLLALKLNHLLVPLILRAMTQRVISEHKRSHSLDHWHRPWQDAGIVTAPASEGGIFQIFIHRILLVHHRGHGFERHTEVYRFPV